MIQHNLKILFFGPGAIGGSSAAWVAKHHEQTFLYGRRDTVEVIRERGLSLYFSETPQQKVSHPLKVIENLEEARDVDVVAIAVKLYDLEAVAREIREKLGDRAIVIGLQNGLENQKILPKYFSRVVYCVVCYNAWTDQKGVIGYEKKGPLILGTPDNSLQEEINSIARVFGQGVETLRTDRFQDAAYGKLVMNLSNSITTLVGLNVQPIQDIGLFQKIIANLLNEGVQVIRAAGHREVRLGGMPSWLTLWAVARLPQRLTQPMFQRNLKKMVMSSMGQDVLKRSRSVTELEYLNGCLLALADQYAVRAPYNRAVYRLCQHHFSQPGFKPLEVGQVWEEIVREMRPSG